MQLSDERMRLADELWRAEWASTACSVASANEEMCDFFEMQSLDEAESRKPKALRNQQSRSRWEGVLPALTRWHNVHKVPIVVAEFYNPVPNGAVLYLGALILPEARRRDLCPRYKVVTGISPAVFDNFSIRAAGGLMVNEEPGEQLNMTNWASLAIPEAALGSRDLAQQVQQQLSNGGSIFCGGLPHDELIDLFSSSHRDLVRFSAARFTHSMLNCDHGTFDQKSTPTLHLPRTYMKLQIPIWDRLQSSYDEVNAELYHIRQSASRAEASVVFVGCDGLGYLRLIHRLSQDPRQFLETTPIVIPQLGEHPHVRADPKVSAFHEHEHFLLTGIHSDMSRFDYLGTL
eukprot:3645040-Pleurochrysis_carterae.AAC.2